MLQPLNEKNYIRIGNFGRLETTISFASTKSACQRFFSNKRTFDAVDLGGTKNHFTVSWCIRSPSECVVKHSTVEVSNASTDLRQTVRDEAKRSLQKAIITSFVVGGEKYRNRPEIDAEEIIDSSSFSRDGLFSWK
ncbi:hypothetical protein CDAR_257981 [Caerostris darwini]|uniref:Uncharacterized protein n=1 Tax=Caerostris darwini TaxID=1538125 RepID=A0AAV4WW96_9ARAC|nr:hypothetical protein CDAR_257981 [Caerostris darwini]